MSRRVCRKIKAGEVGLTVSAASSSSLGWYARAIPLQPSME